MIKTFSCKCGERRKPVTERNWVVVRRRRKNFTFGATPFGGSDYSTVYCLSCRAMGRTKARYVDELRDAK